MMSDILLQRISALGPANAVEQENMLQELMQHLVLASLSRAGFFSVGCFHGGTCLRILYGTSRFSEDLDFLLKKPDSSFRWGPFLEHIRRDCLADGIHFEVQDKKRTDTVVQKAFLKTDSIGQVLTLDLPFQRDQRKKIRVKLEVDTNPPTGSRFESRYITFPMTAAITTPPRMQISPSSVIFSSTPGPGLPTLPKRNSLGVLIVAAPVSSVMPQISRILMPTASKNTPSSRASGAPVEMKYFTRPPVAARILPKTRASATACLRDRPTGTDPLASASRNRLPTPTAHEKSRRLSGAPFCTPS